MVAQSPRRHSVTVDSSATATTLRESAAAANTLRGYVHDRAISVLQEGESWGPHVNVTIQKRFTKIVRHSSFRGLRK